MRPGQAIADAQLLLYQALAEPIGLLVQTDNFRLLTARLYRARQEANDPDLAVLQFRQSPVEGGELIIVKETIELPAELDSEEEEESDEQGT